MKHSKFYWWWVMPLEIPRVSRETFFRGYLVCFGLFLAGCLAWRFCAAIYRVEELKWDFTKVRMDHFILEDRIERLNGRLDVLESRVRR